MKHQTILEHFSPFQPIYGTHYLYSHFGTIYSLSGYLVWMQIAIIWMANFDPLTKTSHTEAQIGDEDG